MFVVQSLVEFQVKQFRLGFDFDFGHLVFPIWGGHVLNTFQVAIFQVHWAQAECRGVCCSITCRVSSNLDLDLDFGFGF